MEVALEPKLIVHLFHNPRIYGFLKAHAGHQLKVSLNYSINEDHQRENGDIILYCQDCKAPMVGFVKDSDQKMDFEEGTREDIRFVVALLQQSIDILNKTIPDDFDDLHDEVANLLVDLNTGKAFIAVALKHFCDVLDSYLEEEE